MDQFLEELLNGDIRWYESPLPPKQSAFVPYIINKSGSGSETSSVNPDSSVVVLINNRNMNKRMIEILRKNQKERIEALVPEREKCYKHMVNERMRREKLKQSFSALHSILPNATKNDKNSIVQTAANRIEELMGFKEELNKRKREFEGNLVAKKTRSVHEGSKIRFNVPNPISGVDSMLEVLKCLKSLGSKTISIEAKFCAQELSAVMDVENQIEGAEVEKWVEKALEEIERKARLKKSFEF